MLNQSNAYSPANLYGSAYGMTQGLGAQIFQPESQYNSALIGANRQEAMSVQMANQQASNARSNAIIGGVASIGGALLTGGMSAMAQGLSKGVSATMSAGGTSAAYPMSYFTGNK
jgi:hypothetical protein